jgi:3-deoxy-D-manno-octulosonate 8-phosphate phosphatase (KDO 8-P phosphatase)
VDYTKWKDIKCFVFDVDGVFTDTHILVTESGELLRTMNVRDGQAIKFALSAGYRIAIFTKGASMGVRKRLEGLGIKDIFDRLDDKEAAFDQYIAQHQISTSDVLYMGDDIPDLVLLEKVGLPTCPSDATPEVMAKSMFVSSIGGGKGCVRDVITRVMKAQNTWPV